MSNEAEDKLRELVNQSKSRAEELKRLEDEKRRVDEEKIRAAAEEQRLRMQIRRQRSEDVMKVQQDNWEKLRRHCKDRKAQNSQYFLALIFLLGVIYNILNGF